MSPLTKARIDELNIPAHQTYQVVEIVTTERTASGKLPVLRDWASNYADADTKRKHWRERLLGVGNCVGIEIRRTAKANSLRRSPVEIPN